MIDQRPVPLPSETAGVGHQEDNEKIKRMMMSMLSVDFKTTIASSKAKLQALVT
jgi:hypothetical protein